MNVLVPFFVFAGGLAPAEMADVVSERLSRLDKLSITLEARMYRVPFSESPRDRSAWGDAIEPGDGGCRTIQLVRPYLLEHSSRLSGGGPEVFSGFSPGRAVRRAPGTDRQGRAVFVVSEDAITSTMYTHVPLTQLLDLQIYQSLVPGLSVERLLRDYSGQLVGFDGDVSTYSVSLHADGFIHDVCESYEIDINSRGTPLRCHFTMQVANGDDFVFESEFFAIATTEINGAEFVTEAIVSERNSVVPHFGVHHLLVSSAAAVPTLTLADVQLRPATQNSHLFITHADGSDAEMAYDEHGDRVAGVELDASPALAWLPRSASIAICAVLASAVVFFVQSRRSMKVS